MSHEKFREYVSTATALEEEEADAYKKMEEDMEKMRTGKQTSAFKVSGPD